MKSVSSVWDMVELTLAHDPKHTFNISKLESRRSVKRWIAIVTEGGKYWAQLNMQRNFSTKHEAEEINRLKPVFSYEERYTVEVWQAV